MYERHIKRIFDLVGGTVLFVLLSPVFAIIAVVIKLDSRGPVFYRQARTGLGGTDFMCMKFRTMAADNDAHDRSSSDRMTVSGKILRRLSLDELPQLIHVIRGEMSFIGPRPWMTDYYKLMTDQQRRRNSVRPGITGLAQAYGRNHLTIHEKIAYDLEYIDSISLIHDIKVICFTVKSIFDESSVNAGKGGIHEELDTLRSQTVEG